MSHKTKMLAVTLSVLAALTSGANAFASTYNGTVVAPQADGITYTVNASAGDTLTLTNVGQSTGQLTLAFKNNASGNVVVKASTTTPAGVASAPSGTVATYYDVTLNGLTNADINSSTWNFSTPKSFVNRLGLTSANIFLEHFNGTSWDRLNTKLVSSDATTQNFSASVTSFSPFAVVAVPGLTNTGTPYGLLVGGGIAVLAIIGVAYFLTRKHAAHKA